MICIYIYMICLLFKNETPLIDTYRFKYRTYEPIQINTVHLRVVKLIVPSNYCTSRLHPH